MPRVLGQFDDPRRWSDEEDERILGQIGRPRAATRTPVVDLSGMDTRYLPSLSTRLTQPERPNLVGSALRTGINESLGLGIGAASAALGKATGLESLERAGGAYADRKFEDAARSRRDDQEVMPWSEEGGGLMALPKFAAYQTIKNLPRMLPGIVAGAVSRNPSTAAKVAFGTALPEAVGSMYQEARDRGDPTRADALKAMGLAAPYAAMDVVLPTLVGRALAGSRLPGMVGKAMESTSLVKRVATAGTLGALSEIPQEAAQTAMELSFRPDLSPVEKMRQIIDAGLTGGVVGGTLGSVGGIRRAKSLSTNDLLNNPDALNTIIDEELNGVPVAPAAPAAPTSGPDGQLEMFPDAPGVVPTAPASPLVVPEPVEPVDLDRIVGPIEAPAPAPVASQDQQQSDLFPEEVERIPRVDNMREVARDLVGAKAKQTPFVDQLNVASPEELVQVVSDRLKQGGRTSDLLALGERLGLVNTRGRARNLPEEIAKLEAEQFAVSAESMTPGQATQFQQRQRRIDEMRTQLQLIEAAGLDPQTAAPTKGRGQTASRSSAQSVPPSLPDGDPGIPGVIEPPVSGPMLRPTAPEEAQASMQDAARQIVGRKTQFTSQTQATTEQELAIEVFDALDKGRSGNDVMRLGEFFGFFDQNGDPIDFPARIASLEQAVQAAPSEQARAEAVQELEYTQWQSTMVAAVEAARTSQETKNVANEESPASLPAGRDAEARGQDVAPDGAAVRQESAPATAPQRQEEGQAVSDQDVRQEGRPVGEEVREEGAPGVLAGQEVADLEAQIAPAPVPAPAAAVEELVRQAELVRKRDYDDRVEKAAAKDIEPRVRQKADGTISVLVGTAKFFDAKSTAEARQFIEAVQEARASKVRQAQTRNDPTVVPGGRFAPRVVPKIEEVVDGRSKEARQAKAQEAQPERPVGDVMLERQWDTTAQILARPTISPELRAAAEAVQQQLSERQLVAEFGALLDMADQEAKAAAASAPAPAPAPTKQEQAKAKQKKSKPSASAPAPAPAPTKQEQAKAKQKKSKPSTAKTIAEMTDAEIQERLQVLREKRRAGEQTDADRTEASALRAETGRRFEAGRDQEPHTIVERAFTKLNADPVGRRDFAGPMTALREALQRYEKAERTATEREQTDAAAGYARRAAIVREGYDRMKAVEESSPEKKEFTDAFNEAFGKNDNVQGSTPNAARPGTIASFGTGENKVDVMRSTNSAGELVLTVVQGTTTSEFTATTFTHPRQLVIGPDALSGNPTDARAAGDFMATEFARQAELAQQFPNGPFRADQPNVLGSPTMPKAQVAFVRALMNKLGLGDVKIFLTTRGDMRRQSEEMGLVGPYGYGVWEGTDAAGYAAPVPGRPGEYVVMTPTAFATSGSVSNAVSLEILAHEVGHVVKFEAFDRASSDVQQGILDDYNAFVRETESLEDDGEIAERTRGAAFQAETNEYAPLTTQQSIEYREYVRRFDEWFADQVSRWATTDATPTSPVQQFFKAVADKIQQIVSFMTGQEYVAPSMQSFLESSPGSQRMWSAQPVADTAIQAFVSQGPAFGAVQKALAATQSVIRRATRLGSALDQNDKAAISARKLALGWSSVGHIRERYGKYFTLSGGGLKGITNGLESYLQFEQERATVGTKMAEMFGQTYYDWEALQRRDSVAAELVNKLMTYTEMRIDPSKSWSEHTWLRGPDVPFSRQDQLQAEVMRANNDYRALRSRKGLNVYTQMKEANQAVHYAQMANEMHYLVTSDETLDLAALPTFQANPVDGYRTSAALQGSAAQTASYWKLVVERQIAEVTQFLAATDPKNKAAKAAGQPSVSNRIRPMLEKQLSSMQSQLEVMEQAPYFHLGRFGDQFLSFAIPRGSPAAVQRVADRLAQAGFDGFQISADTDQGNAYMQFEDADQLNAVFELVKDMRTEGLLPSDTPMVKGKRSAADPTVSGSPQWFSRLVESIEASPMFRTDEAMTLEERNRLEEMRQTMVTKARELMLDMMPDISVSKVMVRREGKPGYTKDMVRSYAFRMQVAATALSNLSASAKISGAFAAMRAAVEEANRDDATSPRDAILMANVVAELTQRVAERPMRSGTGFIDTWRAINHAWFLGMSPSYALVNMTQIGVLLWPELAKKHGYVRAAKAMSKMTPVAFKIMKATFESGKALGWKRLPDANITESALMNAGLDPETAEFVLQMVNTGAIEMGSSARELSRVSDARMDSKTDLTLRYAASFGYYTETYSRLLAALSARELSDAKSSPETVSYAVRTVNESMLNYSSWYKARQMGKMGVAGKFSEVMFSFMTYQAQLLEKLYREVAVGFIDSASTPQEKAAAKRFLGGHLAAMMVFAGSLGMPMATVLARAAEKLVDLFDDDEEPYDITAAWRNFLADSFGKGMGEVLARGAPRALGFDIARRVGEQDILPFSGLLTDRRRWEDASSDWAVQAMGAPVSMVRGIIEGGGRLMDGDVLGAARFMLPTSIRGPVEAFRMSQDGYKDNRGNTLPLTPKANEILLQAMGLTPARRAEYSEANLRQIQRRGDLAQQASILRSRIAQAVERRDNKAFQDAIAQARKFDQSNPAYGVIRTLPEALRRRERARQQAQLTRTPLGTNLRDPGSRALTRYADY